MLSHFKNEIRNELSMSDEWEKGFSKWDDNEKFSQLNEKNLFESEYLGG